MRDEMDRQLLERLQDEIPLVERPFAQLAESLGTTEHDVLQRARRLADAGMFRRVGGSFVPARCGYCSALFAAEVPPERVSAAAEWFAVVPEITHAYEREDALNVWFTVIARDAGRLREVEQGFRSAIMPARVLVLPARQTFKTRVFFRLDES